MLCPTPGQTIGREHSIYRQSTTCGSAYFFQPPRTPVPDSIGSCRLPLVDSAGRALSNSDLCVCRAIIFSTTPGKSWCATLETLAAVPTLTSSFGSVASPTIVSTTSFGSYVGGIGLASCPVYCAACSKNGVSNVVGITVQT